MVSSTQALQTATRVSRVAVVNRTTILRNAKGMAVVLLRYETALEVGISRVHLILNCTRVLCRYAKPLQAGALSGKNMKSSIFAVII